MLKEPFGAARSVHARARSRAMVRQGCGTRVSGPRRASIGRGSGGAGARHRLKSVERSSMQAHRLGAEAVSRRCRQDERFILSGERDEKMGEIRGPAVWPPCGVSRSTCGRGAQVTEFSCRCDSPCGGWLAPPAVSSADGRLPMDLKKSRQVFTHNTREGRADAACHARSARCAGQRGRRIWRSWVAC